MSDSERSRDSALAASNAWATWGLQPDNDLNAFGDYPWIPGDNSGASFTLPNGPSATVDGAVWMKKTSGTWPSTGSQYQLFDPDGVGWSIRTTVYYLNTSSNWAVYDDLNAGYFGTKISDSGGYPGTGRAARVKLPGDVKIVGTDTSTFAYTGMNYPQVELYVRAVGSSPEVGPSGRPTYGGSPTPSSATPVTQRRMRPARPGLEFS